MPTLPDPTATVKAAEKVRFGFERLRGLLVGEYGSPLPEAVEAQLRELDADLETMKQSAATIGRQARDAMRDRQAQKRSDKAAEHAAIQTPEWQKTVRLLAKVGVQFPERCAATAAANGLHWFKVRALAYVFDHNRAKLGNDAARLYKRIVDQPADRPILEGWQLGVGIPAEPLYRDPAKLVPWGFVKCESDLDAANASPERREKVRSAFLDWLKEQLSKPARA